VEVYRRFFWEQNGLLSDRFEAFCSRICSRLRSLFVPSFVSDLFPTLFPACSQRSEVLALYLRRRRGTTGLTNFAPFQKSRGRLASSGGAVRRISASVITRRCLRSARPRLGPNGWRRQSAATVAHRFPRSELLSHMISCGPWQDEARTGTWA